VVRADGEEIALDALEHGVEILVQPVRSNETKPGVQLVDLAVGVHARVSLADASLVEQRCIACVARPRVQFHVRT
jgi:hypothetical protein